MSIFKRHITGIFMMAIALSFALPAFAQRPVKEYYLTIKDQKVTKAGHSAQAVTINDSIPGPTLYFTEGDSAVIHIKNEMKVASSIHWHGVLIPNYYDGVPYLSTPPIAPGKTFTVRFHLRQTGTYWYHSHSMFQEQSGLYGAIVIYPKKPVRHYDKEIVLLLSDWTTENPKHVMNNLKRGLEWYSIKKGQAQSLNRVIAHHGFGERFQMAWQRMPPMDISDVYYNAFLTNGSSSLNAPDVHPGEPIRLRVIDGSSSTFFHLQFAGGKMQVIAADGQDVKPVAVNRLLMGIAETYDVVITIPASGKYEFRATAQDGSGHTSVYLGKGALHEAPALPKPDVFHLEGIMMEGMAGMKMKMNGMTMDMSPKMMQREMPYLKKDYIDREDINTAGTDNMYMGDMDMGNMQMGDMSGMNSDSTVNQKMDMGKADDKTGDDKMETGMSSMAGMKMGKLQQDDSVIFNYNMLRALHPTAFDTTGHQVRHLTFNLTGSMWRYNWSINGKTLSEKDSILVHKGEILRITMNNATMMYHPMHLHGHFFRLVNDNGTYSPLKHTVIVPPMRSITIEFLADEPGDWFFHCHILYHMMAGMARSFQYADYQRPDTMKNYPMKRLFNDDNHWYFWGNGTVASNRGEGYVSYSNRKNWIQVSGDYGWDKRENEITGSYEYFVGKFLRPYAGVVTSNKDEYLDYFRDNGKTVPQQDTRGLVGVRYLLPLFLNADLRIDTRAHARFTLSGETWLFQRLWLTYMGNTDKEYEANLEYMLSQYISLSGGYSSDYRWGGGVMVRF
ncbi:MAG: multicopper oxidase domain-containing protein [Bacteroidetes bacterium]|nr:multicopper oxidase domain-containing protein [Bacteroidota bacterium]